VLSISAGMLYRRSEHINAGQIHTVQKSYWLIVAEQFFTTWDFEAYKSAFRSGLPVKGRRERLLEYMQQVRRITHPLVQAS
jgi:hypothetical protein